MTSASRQSILKTRQKLDKYRIEQRIAKGGFAVVYRAYDTIEGVRVALKVPRRSALSDEALQELCKEVRLTSGLEHPNILPVKNAAVSDEIFFIAWPLGKESLEDRLRRRLSPRKALAYAEQMMAAVAFAHEQRIVHCDIKPDNFILFDEDRLRLTDFGISKVAQGSRAMAGSGSGTIGYIAPEQAMGRPSPRSDVFSLGLVIYRMLTHELPVWPFEWPLPGHRRLRAVLRPEAIAWLRRCLKVNERKRFKNAGRMLAAYRQIKRRALKGAANRRASTASRSQTSWRELRFREFRRAHGSVLALRGQCERCAGPTTEPMEYCPWCGHAPRKYTGPTRLPRRCPRCGRGVKSDWKYCAWCHGPALANPSPRTWSDQHYVGRCSSSRCVRREILAFSRYCPWCRTKVRRRWLLPRGSSRCQRCGWGVVPDYWDYCPWCGLPQRHHRSRKTK